MQKHFKIYGHIFQKDALSKYWGASGGSPAGKIGKVVADNAIIAADGPLALTSYLTAATTAKFDACPDITTTT